MSRVILDDIVDGLFVGKHPAFSLGVELELSAVIVNGYELVVEAREGYAIIAIELAYIDRERWRHGCELMLNRVNESQV